MIKLTKQQIAILESALRQPEGFATRPGNMKPAAALLDDFRELAFREHGVLTNVGKEVGRGEV